MIDIFLLGLAVILFFVSILSLLSYIIERRKVKRAYTSKLHFQDKSQTRHFNLHIKDKKTKNLVTTSLKEKDLA
ncbi:small membrane protein [Raoultella ornithinolytica]|uniref:small membrane protein n=1 Tax=Raoultella ornithinolytica TaxID=54291 RepID=UPI0012656582|nr:small membrane protein [Raoultella ornithinolytica]